MFKFSVKTNKKTGFIPTPTLLSLLSVFSKIKHKLSGIEEKYLLPLFSHRNKNTTSKLVSGFTLVELLVTLTIFSIMTGVVLVNQEKFNNTIFLSNLAHDIALTLRQAQSYGVNVREGSGSNPFEKSYGVSFDKGKNNNKNFILFYDIDSDNKYPEDEFGSCSEDSECIERYAIKSGNYISSICAGTGEGEDCISTNYLDISFKRPNPDAIITSDTQTNSSYAKITVSASNGNTKSIIVRKTGQIYVE